MSFTVVAHFCEGKPEFAFPSLAGVPKEGQFFYSTFEGFDGGMMAVAFSSEGTGVTPAMLIEAIKTDFSANDPTFIGVHKTGDNQLIASWAADYLF